MKVLALTTGLNVPSARFRVRQYSDYLLSKGVLVDEYYSKFSAYPPNKDREIWAIKSLMNRIPAIINTYKSDVTWIQKPFISTYSTFEGLTKNPRVFDVDDAIFLRKNGIFAQKIAEKSQAVFCGNEYLANYFENYNSNIYIIPTAVDTNRFKKSIVNDKVNDEEIVIGWSGTSGGYKYIETLEKAFLVLFEKYTNIKLRITSDKAPKFHPKIMEKIDFEYWSKENEVNEINKIDIGIMPLNNDEFTLGKCSYKMLLYMACEKPVVVSDIGMNSKVLSQGQIGYGCNSIDEWIECLSVLIENAKKRKEFGIAGKKVVEENYSINVVGNNIYEAFRRIK
ncbi:MAG: glycosyltransferase family 4 protein [Clostridium sp.]